MKKFIIAIVFALMSLTACTDHDEIVAKYSELYERDIEYYIKSYNRVDSLNTARAERDNWDYTEKLEALNKNSEQFHSNCDYAQFRFNYYTRDGYRKVVDEFIKDFGFYPLEGEYHTYSIKRKPSKNGIAWLWTGDIIY